MRLRPWSFAPLIIALVACADVTVPDTLSPEDAIPRAILDSGYNITGQIEIPANETCGHYAEQYGSYLTGLDWTVNGVLYAQDADWIDFTNDGSPYTVAFGDHSGGWFTEYYSETFYPVPQGERPMSCLTLEG